MNVIVANMQNFYLNFRLQKVGSKDIKYYNSTLSYKIIIK